MTIGQADFVEIDFAPFMSGLLGIGLFLGMVVFYGVVFWTWMVADCARSERLTGKAKARWVSLITLLGPLGALLYGFFGSRRMLFQWISAGFFVFGFFAFALIGRLVSEVQRQDHAEFSNLIRRVGVVNATGVSAEEIVRVTVALDTLRQERDVPWFMGIGRKENSGLLRQLAERMISDGRLTPAECKEWMERYEARYQTGQKDILLYRLEKGSGGD